MAERDYEKDPIVIEATIRVFVYEPINQLEQRIENFNRRSDVQEAALNLVGGYFSDDCGLDEVKVEQK